MHTQTQFYNYHWHSFLVAYFSSNQSIVETVATIVIVLVIVEVGWAFGRGFLTLRKISFYVMISQFPLFTLPHLS